MPHPRKNVALQLARLFRTCLAGLDMREVEVVARAVARDNRIDKNRTKGEAFERFACLAADLLRSNAYVSSIYAFGDQRMSLPCAVRTGEGYAREHGIPHIDLLKIDVEGAEGKVLHGFGAMLERRAIRLIQFEYNRGAIESRFLLRDFYALLRPFGYVLGKLRANGVTFRDYHYGHEDFSGPNYVACLATDHDLIRALASG